MKYAKYLYCWTAHDKDIEGTSIVSADTKKEAYRIMYEPVRDQYSFATFKRILDDEHKFDRLAIKSLSVKPASINVF